MPAVAVKTKNEKGNFTIGNDIDGCPTVYRDGKLIAIFPNGDTDTPSYAEAEVLAHQIASIAAPTEAQLISAAEKALVKRLINYVKHRPEGSSASRELETLIAKTSEYINGKENQDDDAGTSPF